MNLRNGYEILFKNLVGNESFEWSFFMPRKEAYERLKEYTKQDFGFDVGKWKAWLIENDYVREDML